jgi:hypothetical protein
MRWPAISPPRFRRRHRYAGLGLALALLSGCANGDFGRIKPSLVSDDIHSWIGKEAAASVGVPASRYELTDDERQLRDLAYPLIEPPFSRQRWYSLLGEYGINQGPTTPWAPSDESAYSRELMAQPYRSVTTRYNRLIEDIRNDVVRVGPFLRIAARVADMDDKRQRSLAYMPSLSDEERANALSRVTENQLVVKWVHHSLSERAAGYYYALERLLAADPSPKAVDAERAWKLLKMQLGEIPFQTSRGPRAVSRG